MSSASRFIGVVLIAAVTGAVALVAHDEASGRTLPGESLRVCADPNNLPYSNQRGEGFENALAELLARDLGRHVDYTWWPQRRGFIRVTLGAGACDVVMGVPANSEMTLNTQPYYESSYVFVTRRDRHLDLRSLDDPRLRDLRIGVHVVGDDNVPPADALAARRIIANVRGYTVFGDYSRPNPPANLIDAVARGDIDTAIAWGPQAGYFASHARVPLDVEAVAPSADPGMRFAISMGVRRGDRRLQRRLDDVIVQRRAEIDALLDRFHVPRVASAPKPRQSRERSE